MPAIVNKLGPGVLTIGTGPTDFTCQVTAARVEWEVDEGDDVVVLCGETVPGARTYSAATSPRRSSRPRRTRRHRRVLVDQQGHPAAVQVHPELTAAGKQVTGDRHRRPDQRRRRRVGPEHDLGLRVGVRRRAGPRAGRRAVLAADETPTGAEAKGRA